MPLQRLAKGSPEAFAWAEKMRLARKARGRHIRRAGRKLERRFFRKGKLKKFAGMEQMNPGTTYQVWAREPGKRIKRLAVFDSLQAVKQWFDRQSKIHVIEVWKDESGQPEPVSIGQMRKNPTRPHGTFTRCVKSVKKSLKKYHRKGDPKAICGAALRKNPIAIIGNPPRSISARVAGIIYNRVIEIRAQKTSHNKGFYRHPFETEAQILALDNGDLLIHSVSGMRLWGRS